MRGRAETGRQRATLLVTAAIVLLLVAVDLGVLAIGMVLALLVATIVLTATRSDRVRVEDVQ